MKIGFLGLGAMGRRMAARLVAAGHEVTVWNRTPGVSVEGAKTAATPRAAAEATGMVIAMLRDDAASRAVWLDDGTGALAGMGSDALAIECSTLSPVHIARLHAAAQRAGVAFLDAPVAGSRPQAESGSLVFVAGGTVDVVARAEPVLRAMGRGVHHAGGPGAGAVVKLMVNTLLAVEIAALAELMAMVARAGVDIERALAAVADTPVWSPALAGAAGAIRAAAFAPAFPVDLAVKDLRLAVAAGGVSAMPMAAATQAVFAEAARAGYGADNISGVAQLYR